MKKQCTNMITLIEKKLPAVGSMERSGGSAPLETDIIPLTNDLEDSLYVCEAEFCLNDGTSKKHLKPKTGSSKSKIYRLKT